MTLVHRVVALLFNVVVAPPLFVMMLCIFPRQTVARLLRGGSPREAPLPLSEEAQAVLEDETLGTRRRVKLAATSTVLDIVEAGPEDAPLMLFVHGFPECWYSWRFQLRHFAKTHRCVAVNLRGYGDSSKPQQLEAYVADLLADDLRNLIVALGRTEATVVAHDWGGAVAYAFAHLYQEMVSRLIILNAPHPLLFLPNMSVRQLLMSWYIFGFQIPFIPEAAVEYDGYSMLRQMFRGRQFGVKNRENVTPVDVEIMQHEFSKPGTSTAAINYYRNALYADMDMVNPRLKAAYHHRLQMPLLVIWGEDDTALTVELNNDLQRVARISELVVLGGSHWIQQDRPAEVNEHIDRFLSTEQQAQEEESK